MSTIYQTKVRRFLKVGERGRKEGGTVMQLCLATSTTSLQSKHSTSANRDNTPLVGTISAVKMEEA